MARVLISSIGEGRKQADGSYAYENTTYFLAEGNAEHKVQTPSIVSALKELYSIDKLILIGTAGSDWASLYAHLFVGDDDNLLAHTESNDDYYNMLLNTYNQSKSTPPILCQINELQDELVELKDAIGDFCDSIWVMHYGINEDELAENFTIMNNIASRMNDGDEIIFDISHSFRSLPLYELLAVNLAKQIVGKKLRIQAITYGMNASQNMFNGDTPIINLSQLVNVTDWIKAAEEFNRFGTAHLLAELLKDDNLGLELSKEEKKAIKRLGDMATGINAIEFKNLVKNCINISKGNTSTKITQMVLGHVFIKISSTFGVLLDDDAKLFSELAKWHFVHKRYIVCVITLDECVFDFFAELMGVNRHSDNWEWKEERKFRDKIYDANSNNNRVNTLFLDFKRLNEIRNHLAHGGPLDYDVKNLPFFTERMRRTVESQLEIFTKQFSTLINSFRKNENDLNDLTTALM
ncbi:MAG: TIGR02221 family CRISPR-associated protein [Oscillospiraceae bacterium]|nr:TIGR02221 family CRISPR-associated protein [Oscillospiraceae bacterium]